MNNHLLTLLKLPMASEGASLNFSKVNMSVYLVVPKSITLLFDGLAAVNVFLTASSNLLLVMNIGR